MSFCCCQKIGNSKNFYGKSLFLNLSWLKLHNHNLAISSQLLNISWKQHTAKSIQNALVSRNFCEKAVRCAFFKFSRDLMLKKFREINFVVNYTYTITFTNFSFIIFFSFSFAENSFAKLYFETNSTVLSRENTAKKVCRL